MFKPGRQPMTSPTPQIVLLGIILPALLLGCDQGHGVIEVEQLLVEDCIDEAEDRTISLDIMAIGMEEDTFIYRPHEGSGGLYDSNGLTIRVLDRKLLTTGENLVGQPLDQETRCCSQDCGPCEDHEICVPGTLMDPWICVPNVQVYLELFRTCPARSSTFELEGTMFFEDLGFKAGDRLVVTEMNLEIIPQGWDRTSGLVRGELDFEVRMGLPYQPFTGDK